MICTQFKDDKPLAISDRSRNETKMWPTYLLFMIATNKLKNCILYLLLTQWCYGCQFQEDRKTKKLAIVTVIV